MVVKKKTKPITAEDLQEARETVSEIRRQKATLSGQEAELKRRLQETFGVDTLKEAEAELESLIQQEEEAEAQLNRDLVILEGFADSDGAEGDYEEEEDE